MNKILIFRTDRVGDFLISQPFINSINRSFPNSNIDIVCSNKNVFFVKQFKIFSKVILYPNKFFFKIKFFLSIFFSYDVIIVMDGKKRSIFNTLFSFAKLKILFTPSKFNYYIYNFFFKKIYFIDYKIPKISILSKAANFFNSKIIPYDLNINIKGFYLLSKYQKYLDNFIVFNFDEKWIFKNYIKNYKNIEPRIDEFVIFLDILSLKLNKKIFITNGLLKNSVFNYLKSKSHKFDNKLYTYRNNKIFLFDNINIFELQNLISRSLCLVSCHGAPSHLASGYNIPIIDIIDKSELLFFRSYSHHFRKCITLNRDNFRILSKKIINNLKLIL